jgi:hypothetical protein
MKVVEQAERRGSTSLESTRTPWRTAGLAEQASRQESHKAQNPICSGELGLAAISAAS